LTGPGSPWGYRGFPLESPWLALLPLPPLPGIHWRHPHLLAQYLAGTRTRHPVVCRYYTGRPNPHIRGEAEKTRNLDRRLYAMRQVGVTVVHRPLRYHWEWGQRQTLPRPAPGLPGRTVTLYPWQRPQEKGIDLVMALDLIESVLLGRCDVPIVVSLDRDLHEIPLALRKLQPLVGRPVRLEAAVPRAARASVPEDLERLSAHPPDHLRSVRLGARRHRLHDSGCALEAPQLAAGSAPANAGTVGVHGG
jgi:hypothetical protein